MSTAASRITRLAVTASLALAGMGACPPTALAETYEELQQRVEEATAAYDKAVANTEAIKGEIDQNQAKIAEIEAKLPAQRDRAADSLKTLYKMHQSSSGMLELLFSADDFNDFIATLSYLERIQDKNLAALNELGQLSAELQEAKDTLSARQVQATKEADAARQAQDDAVEARDEMVRQAAAQAAAEKAAAQAAIEQASKNAAEGRSFTTASGQETTASAQASTTPIDESVTETAQASSEESQQPVEETPAPAAVPTSDREAFIAKWQPRIDAYLGGSPLGGHGRTFAEAAYDCGVDPRWSPAISCVESGKGAICFRPHNAWGWGSASWGDWDTAIRSHVAGLSSGYGYTLTVAAAQKYCDTWQDWYYAVLGEMNSI